MGSLLSGLPETHLKEVKMKYLLAIILLTISSIGCRQEEARDYSNYRVKLSIEPEEQYLEVDCYWDIARDESTRSVYFYLHNQLQIEEIGVNNNTSFSLSEDTSDIRYMPGATKYVLNIKGLNFNNKTTRLHLKYSGRITEWNEWSPSVIGEEWTEMGLYFPWYPYNPGYAPFTYEVEVVHNGEYRTFMMGNETKDDYYSIYRTANPTNDMVLCMSKDLKIKTRDMHRNSFKLAYTSLSEELTDTLISDIETILDLFNNWFPPGNNQVCIAESMRETGGGYARIGGIYLPGFTESDYYESRKAYSRYLAHEVSHLWWYRANTNTWEDWLNEGFAEYSALMVLRELYGQEYFDKWISNKKLSSSGKDPVWLYDRNGEDAQAVLYDKAPLLLYELEDRIGPGSLKQLMWDLLINRVSNTDEFMTVLEDLEGEETAEWFLGKLKS